jgi:hypothetical protein
MVELECCLGVYPDALLRGTAMRACAWHTAFARADRGTASRPDLETRFGARPPGHLNDLSLNDNTGIASRFGPR